MSNIDIDIQNESSHQEIPADDDLIAWTRAALLTESAEITIRIVDETESAELNATYRHKTGPTNVLSFPFMMDTGTILHGDIVICAPIVNQEAHEQLKSVKDHWAHLTVHGILHLQGFDHIKDADAEEMEKLEIAILATLDIANPYE